jgi:hypothetical protein
MFMHLKRLCLLGLAAATTACSALVAPTPTATLTILPTPAVTRRPPTAVPPTSAPGFDVAPGDVRPPPAELTIGDQTQTSAIGTYCWRSVDDAGTGVGLCADMLGIMTPRDSLAVPPGPFTAELALPLDVPPSTLVLWVYPAAGQPSDLDNTDTLAWQPTDGERYDLELSATPAVTLDLAPGLYVLAVFAQWQDMGDVMYGYLVQVGEPQSVPPPAVGELPASCLPVTANEVSYVDPAGRYCLLYPSSFHTGDLTPDRANFYGPPLDDSVEPVFAALTIEVLGSDGGRPLEAVVEAYLFGVAAEAGVKVARQPAVWGGEPAEVIYGVPGLAPSRQAIVLHAGTVYHIVLLPYDVTAPPALPDVENVWAVVSQSFTFLLP